MARKKENSTAELLPQQGECVVSKFTGKEVRRTFHSNEWWFVLEDIVEALTETKDPKDYIKKIKSRDEGLKEGWGQIVTPLEFQTSGGKQNINCSNVEGILRIIQSIPSKNAEPFKRWLAKTGFERIQERATPHLAIKRAMLDYELQGRNKKWIQTRIQGMITRNKLTDEWKDRGVKEGIQYAILTDAISEGTFGIKTKEHKEIKSLKRYHSLRDNMTETELIFQMLGEQATIDITKNNNPIGFDKNLETAKAGGESAGAAREAFEKSISSKVISEENFLINAPKEALELKVDDIDFVNVIKKTEKPK
jgi:DNA-damage-inducible protein D